MDTTIPDPSIEPVVRCFGGDSPLYQAYHDHEWGVPVHGDTELFERLSLEAFSSGLSWFIVLRKRDHFREVFHGFDPVTVGGFTETDVDRLMQDAGIVRNRPKIEATISNAEALLAFQAGGGSLDQLVWEHQPAQHRQPRSFADYQSKTPESIALAKALKRLGFRWLGPTTCYATMQACGLVNDHMAGCPRATH